MRDVSGNTSYWCCDSLDVEFGLGAAPDEPASAKHLLHGCYPNPFNPRTRMDCELTSSCQVGFRILDLTGKEIWRWGGPQTAGRHSLTWNGQGIDGRPQPSGTYLVQMTAGDFQSTRRLALVR